MILFIAIKFFIFIGLLGWFTRGRRMRVKIDSHFHGNDREGSGNDIKGRIAIRSYFKKIGCHYLIIIKSK
jgi:hypothetical protein